MEQQADAADAEARQDTAVPDANTPPALLAEVMAELDADGPDATFRYGLDMIIAGLEAKRLAARS